VGDYLVSVNGRSLQGLAEVEVQNILRLLPRGIAHLEVSVLPPTGLREEGESRGVLFVWKIAVCRVAFFSFKLVLGRASKTIPDPCVSFFMCCSLRQFSYFFLIFLWVST